MPVFSLPAAILGRLGRKLKIQQYWKTEYTQIITISRLSQKLMVSTNFHFLKFIKIRDRKKEKEKKEKRKRKKGRI